MARTQNKQYEIGFFNSVAENGHYELQEESLYSLLFETIRSCQLAPSGRALECGCGTGAFGRRFINEFRNIRDMTGVDISEEMIRLCCAQSIPNYTPVQGDLESPSLFSMGQFSFVICPFILHHFPTIDLVVQNIGRWTEPGGLLLLVEPNGSSPISRLFKMGRWFIEKMMGSKWIIDKGLATPNETDHRVSTYQKQLKLNGFDILSLRTLTISKPVESYRTWVDVITSAKQLLTMVADRLFKGTVCSGATVIMLARKRN